MKERATTGAEFLQWFGLLGAALVWTGQHVLGFGITVARCSPGGVGWRIDEHVWELTVMAVALALALVAESAAIVTLRRTRGIGDSAAPPDGRRHFFAVGAALGNVLFLAIIVMSGLSTLAFDPCRQA
jgi:hypothetical protein